LRVEGQREQEQETKQTGGCRRGRGIMFEFFSIHTIVHIAVALSFPPLLLGVINRIKAIFAGRRGPPLLQSYFDLRKLFSKESVLSETTTWIFCFGPVVGVAAVLVAAMIMPLGHSVGLLSFRGDLFLLAYALGLARFFTLSAALDTGSAFEGMGAAREATYACLAEPVMFFGFLVLARVTGSLSMSGLFGSQLQSGWQGGAAALLLILISWFVLLLVENCRIPFDDPNTHLELTMIHEVMVLDHSGPAFGLILYGAAVKLFVFAALLVRLAFPVQSGFAVLDWVIFLAGTIVVASLVGVVESVMARLRLSSIPNLLVGAGVLSLFGLILVLVRR
jgi:formate hydrogenlyase subunit 4